MPDFLKGERFSCRFRPYFFKRGKIFMVEISGFPLIWDKQEGAFCRKLAQKRDFLGLKEETFSW
jgi:hypothetical protein